MQFRWAILVVATLTQLAAALASQGVGVWTPLAQQTLQVSNGEIGLLAALLNCVPIAGLVAVGPLLDRYGDKLPILMGMALLCLSMVFLGAASSYDALALTMLVMGLGYTPIQPGGSKAVYHWFPAKERGLAMGIRQAALPLGGACAAAFFPYMITRSGWMTAMLVAAGIIAFVALVHMAFFRNAPGVRLAAASRLKLSSLFRFSQFRKIAAVGAAMVGVQATIAVFWAVFAHQHFGLGLSTAAWQLFAAQLSGAAGRILLSAISDHLHDGRRRMVLTCSLVTLVALSLAISLPADTNIRVILICSAVIGVFSFGWYGPWVVWLSECAGSTHVGQVLGAAMSVNQVAIALTPLMFGFFLDLAPYPAGAWLFVAALLVLAAVGALRSIPNGPSEPALDVSSDPRN
ncbi:putative MFS-type transporter [Castellaniella defragrans]